MHRPTTFLILFLLSELCSAYFYSMEPFQQQIEQPYGAYQFSYETGSKNQPELAHSFRQESRDEYGNVVGKYGYVDPYGQLRIVNYRAGADGYYATGDIGVDQEALRQQRLLYSNDEATQIQQQTWQQQQARNSASASAAASASSSSSYSGDQQRFNNDGSSSRQDWTTVNDYSGVINQQYSTKGGQQRFTERLIAAPVKSSGSFNYRTNQFGRQITSTNNQYVSPVRKYSTITYHTIPGAIQSTKYVAQTKSNSGYSGSLKSPSAKLTEKQNTIPVYQPLNSYHSSASAASASAAASSASSSSSASTAASWPTKGGKSSSDSEYIDRSARYSIPGNGKAHARVHFKQFGPTPFQYSYSF